MATEHCRVCGGRIQQGTERCPHCGARLAPSSSSRLWVFTFFLLGVVIGLLWWVLEGGGFPTPLLQPQVESAARHKSAVPAPREPKRRSTAAAPAKKPPPQSTTSPLPGTVVEPLRCDRQSAQAVRDKALTLASIDEQGGVVVLNLTREWEFYLPGHRRGFVEAFSEAERCLHGTYREIRFYYQGREVASVSTRGAIRIK